MSDVALPTVYYLTAVVSQDFIEVDRWARVLLFPSDPLRLVLISSSPDCLNTQPRCMTINKDNLIYKTRSLIEHYNMGGGTLAPL